MKPREIEVGKWYNNGSAGKWNQTRAPYKIDGNDVYYTVTAGRDHGRNGTMKLQSFAAWAVSEVKS